jgi:rhodanese-related sulfurtransferase
MTLDTIPEITPRELAERLKRGSTPALLDVRFEEERTRVKLPDAFWVPLPELASRAEELVGGLKGQQLVVYCHHGVRSRHAAGLLRSLGVDASSLAGGIDRYAVEVDPSLPRY